MEFSKNNQTSPYIILKRKRKANQNDEKKLRHRIYINSFNHITYFTIRY